MTSGASQKLENEPELVVYHRENERESKQCVSVCVFKRVMFSLLSAIQSFILFAKRKLIMAVSAGDVQRAQVLSLFSQCDNDVKKLQETIVRSLQESGRRDIKIQTDNGGAIMVVSQAKAHARGHTSFAQKLQDMQVEKEGAEAMKRINAIQIDTLAGVEIPDGSSILNPDSAAGKRGPKRGASTVEWRQHLEGSKHCFARTEKDYKLGAFPTSKYSGNHILRRYGGAFPKHGNYGFYRKYGTDGRGAASAEFHNFPNGDRPDTSTLYS